MERRIAQLLAYGALVATVLLAACTTSAYAPPARGQEITGTPRQPASTRAQPRDTGVYPLACRDILVGPRVNQRTKPPDKPYEYVLCTTTDGRDNVLFVNDAYPNGRIWEEVSGR